MWMAKVLRGSLSRLKPIELPEMRRRSGSSNSRPGSEMPRGENVEILRQNAVVVSRPKGLYLSRWNLVQLGLLPCRGTRKI